MSNSSNSVAAGGSPLVAADHKVFISTLHAGDLLAYLQPAVTAVSGGSHLPVERQRLMKELTDCDGLISVVEDKIDDELLAAHPRLKVVANVAVGYDNIDVPAATRHGVLICNTPGVLDNTTADLAFSLLLATARRIVESDKYVRAGKWKQWTTDLFLGTDPGCKTLGIIGLGRIGQAMARRALGFGMNIIYSQRKQAAADIESQLKARHVSVEQLLQESDFISIHCPLTPETRHLVGKQQFALMKRGCILINTARGAIIDEQAMIDALRAGILKGAGLDVFEQEPKVTEQLLTMENVVLTPHIGSASVETRWAMARLAADGAVSALAGKLPKNAVNPDVWPKFLERLKAELVPGG